MPSAISADWRTYFRSAALLHNVVDQRIELLAACIAKDDADRNRDVILAKMPARMASSPYRGGCRRSCRRDAQPVLQGRRLSRRAVVRTVPHFPGRVQALSFRTSTTWTLCSAWRTPMHRIERRFPEWPNGVSEIVAKRNGFRSDPHSDSAPAQSCGQSGTPRVCASGGPVMIALRSEKHLCLSFILRKACAEMENPVPVSGRRCGCHSGSYRSLLEFRLCVA